MCHFGIHVAPAHFLAPEADSNFNSGTDNQNDSPINDFRMSMPNLAESTRHLYLINTTHGSYYILTHTINSRKLFYHDSHDKYCRPFRRSASIFTHIQHEASLTTTLPCHTTLPYFFDHHGGILSAPSSSKWVGRLKLSLADFSFSINR